MELSCTSEEQVRVHLRPVSSKGTPVGLDGLPTIEVLSGSGTAEVTTTARDGSTLPADTPDVIVRSGSAIGEDCVFKLSGDADPTSGVKLIDEVITLHVGPPSAAGFGLTADAPEPKP